MGQCIGADLACRSGSPRDAQDALRSRLQGAAVLDIFPQVQAPEGRNGAMLDVETAHSLGVTFMTGA